MVLLRRVQMKQSCYKSILNNVRINIQLESIYACKVSIFFFIPHSLTLNTNVLNKIILFTNLIAMEYLITNKSSFLNCGNGKLLCNGYTT